MKRLVWTVSVLLMLMDFSGVSYSGQMGGAGSGFMVHKRFSGSFGELDADGGRFSVTKVVNDKETRMVFVIDQHTKVVMGNEEKKLPDLKGGDKVTVVYVRSDDSFVAEKIIVEK